MDVVTPHTDLLAYISEDIIAFQPVNTENDKTLETLSIDFKSGSVQLLPSEPQKGSPVPVVAILGICKLFKGFAVVVATAATVVATVLGAEIFEVTEVKVITPREFRLGRDNRKLIKLLADGFMPNGTGRTLYFSYFYDITLSAQRTSLVARDASPAMQTAAGRAELQYFWNAALLKPINAAGAHKFVVPAMLGFVQQLSGLKFHADKAAGGTTGGTTSASLVLIARRSVHRAGTRHWRRGADSEGRVANFVETEQLLQLEPKPGEEAPTISSYVQIRGSIPLLWTEMPNLKYKPTKQIAIDELQLPAFKKHANSLKDQYKEAMAINLINQHGGEGKLAKAFQDFSDRYACAGNTSFKYVPFDFHKECGTKSYHRLSILWDQISSDMSRYGYFLHTPKGVVSKQMGVVRTNCIDCLDRTNVVQGMLGRKALEATLTSLGLLAKDATLPSAYPEVEKDFKILWADHGDAIALQYAGTGALKSGFTRTGKRTYGGILDDGYKSIARYYLNNFADGRKQDAVDLVTGSYIPDHGSKSPFKRQYGPLFPLAAALVCFYYGISRIFHAFNSLVTSQSSEFDSRDLAVNGFAPILVGAILILTVMKIGKHLVNKPQLCPQLAATVLVAKKLK
ncbi:hypothetical protein CEUSTIGMA_g4188.t1 [Chlamydomonas eustigma]|uniref:SAC domain-containing protein n=1 Tax=Chlamydomonas eustigma TaxID=1157962 RepID=A0A250X0Y1_9CHLO|nr:hypothetical protein CEUSTIGMA_g4188.t1 [Chlamydomonas eustigma]|eukprot:GAX76741.1 hypothetical protein CEUSTIGMA_g4188.t1 [Chlamydomonas eustigma]